MRHKGRSSRGLRGYRRGSTVTPGTVEETAPTCLLGPPALQHVFQRLPGRDRSARRTEVDHVVNRSIYIQSRRGSMVHRGGRSCSKRPSAAGNNDGHLPFLLGKLARRLTVPACRVV